MEKYFLVNKVTKNEDVSVSRGTMPTTVPGNSNELQSAAALIRTLKGEKFVVYRFVLLTDVFTVNSNRATLKSSGGIYMLPASLHPNIRRTTKLIRTLAPINHQGTRIMF